MAGTEAPTHGRFDDDRFDLAARLATAEHENARLRLELGESRNLIRFNPQILWVTDGSGRVTFMSERGPQVTGIAAGDLLGFGWFRAAHEDDLRPMLKVWARSARRVRPFDVKHRLRLRGGASCWMRSRALPHRNAGGQVVAWFGCTEEIDDLKRAQDQAHGALAELRAVYDTAPIGLCVIDAELRWVRINNRLAEINGLPVEAHIGRRFRDLLPGLPDAAERLLRQVVTTGEAVHDIELVGETPAAPGVTRIWNESFVPLRDARGEVVGINIVAEEVTQRRRAAEALAASEARFRAMADNIPQLAWMAQPDGETFWFNRRWNDYAGAAATGWRGQLHPEHMDRVGRHFDERIGAGQPWEDTFPLRGADGRYRWFLSRAEPIHGEQGRVALWFGTHTDVTERKAAEEHRELLIHELNHRVKNTLAMVQSVASQTLRGRCDNATWDDLQGRIFALSSAHDLLTCRNWESVELRDLAQQALSAHMRAEGPSRLSIEGPPCSLEPKPALALRMALHELVTNAVKYGALSNAAGNVRLSWTLEGDVLHLTWRESDGPPVTPPQRRGFGSRLIERGLPADLGGSAELDFQPTGLVCRLSVRQPHA